MDLRIIDEARPVAPGERVVLRLQLGNDGRRPARARVRLVGTGGLEVSDQPWLGPIEPGQWLEADVAVVVPAGQSPGDQRIGVEVTGDDGTVALGHVTLSLASAAPVALSISPARVSGRRRGRFQAHLTNRGDETIKLRLDGEGEGLDVAVTPDTVVLPPGDRVRLQGRVRRSVAATGRGRRAVAQTLGDDPRLFTVVAQGHTTPVRATAAYAPRPLVPVGARKLTAIVVAMAVWAAALTAGVQFLDRRAAGQAAEQARQEAAAQAAAEAAGGGTGGDGTSGEAGGGPGGGAGGEGEEGEGTALAFADSTAVDVGGTVDLGSADPAGVTVTLRAVSPADVDTPGVGKVSALHDGPTPVTGLLATRTTTSNEEGDWAFANVAAPGTYEARFAKAGYVTRSHLISLDAGDEPVALDVALDPGDGRLGGLVSAGGAPVGGATVTITDGTVSYTTSTATATTGTGSSDGVGRWSVEGLATPGRYLVTIDRRGFGTETQALELAAGGTADAITTTLTPGVGSISGSIQYLGQPKGGVTVTATNGDVTRSTSSLTETDIGSFLLPQLPLPGNYTVTVSADGFITQTLDVALNGTGDGSGGDGGDGSGSSGSDGKATGVVVQLVSSAAIVAGTVTDGAGQPVSGVGVTASDGTHVYKTTTAIAPAGSYELTGMEPGSYVIGFDRFEYQPASSLVTVAAGDVRPLDVALEAKDAPSITSEASVSVSPEDGGVLVPGATVKLQGASTHTTTTVGPDNRYTLSNIPVGTYMLTISHPSYQTVIQTVRLGPRTHVERTVALQALGDLFGVVTDTDGIPVPGAAIIVSFQTTVGNQTVTSSLDPLFTDVDGSYSIERKLGSQQYTVTFSADGFVTATRQFAGQTGTSTELNVSLFSQPRITGVLRFRNSSGVPVALTGVAGVTVQFRPAGTSDPFAEVPVSSTDGSYTIPNTALAVGSWELALTGLPARFATPTLPDTSNLALNEIRTADITLPVNPSLSGTVRAMDGDAGLQPVPSATIQAERFDTGSNAWAAVGAAVTTNASGQYTIPADQLTAGTWRLRATDVGAGNLATTGPQFTLNLDTSPTENLQVDANPQVSVTVRDKNLTPLAGVTVSYKLLDIDAVTVLDTGSTTTNGSGVARFTKTDLVEGLYELTVTGPSGLQDTLVLALQNLARNQVTGLTATLFPDPTVDGFVRRLNSSNLFVGVSGRTVTIERASDGGVVASTTSGAGGYFSFDPDALDPGDYRVVLGADLRAVDVTALANNEARSVELIVPQSSTVSGTLHWLDATGTRHDLEAGAAWHLSAANVITDHTASTPTVVEVRGSLTASGTGPNWSAAGQAAGSATYTITVDDGRFDDAATTVTVAPGTDPAAVDVALTPRPATISGSVTADGNPLSGATVTLDPGAGGTVRTATTDVAGHWSRDDLLPGTWTITVAKANFQVATQPGTVTVGPGEAGTAGPGDLNQLRTVTVRVAANGSPLSGVTVNLGGGSFAHTEPTPGTHVFAGVPEGDHAVTVSRAGYAVTDVNDAVTTVPDITVAWGSDPAPLDVTLSAFATIGGKLRGTTAGNTNPLVGYTVTATLQGSGSPGVVVTAVTQPTDGTFTLSGLVQGTWDVTVDAPGFVDPGPIAQAVTWNSGTTDLGNLTLAAQKGSIQLAVWSDNFDPPEPIAGASVALRLKGSSTVLATLSSPDPESSPTPTGVTFTDLDAATYTLTLSATGYADVTIEYALARGENAAIGQGATLLEANTGGIVGTIEWRRQSSATPVAPFTGATIVLNRIRNGSSTEVARISSSSTASYSFLVLRNGSYTVTVSGVGIGTVTTSVSVTSGQVTTADVLVTASPVAVTASTRDDTGAALGGVALQLTGFATYSATTATTGTVGSATFAAVQPATTAYTLTATRSGYDPATATVTVGPGGAVTVPPLTLNRQGTAHVTVTDDAGDVVSGATVALTADPTHTALWDAANSRYVLADLPTGVAHQLTVTAADHHTNATVSTPTVTPGATVTAAVTLQRHKGTLQVEVTDDGTDPLSGAAIVVTDAGGNEVGNVTPAGASHGFTNLAVADGPYTVTVSKSFWSTSTQTRTVVVDATVTATAALQPRPTLQVTVAADPSGPANPTVTVKLRKASDGTFTGAVTHSTATTFDFPDLVAGTYDGYQVVSTAAGYHPLTQVVPVTLTQGALVTDSSVSLVALGTIRVTVTDDQAANVNDATVVLSSVSQGGTVATLSAGTNGVYSFTGLSAATDYVATVTRTGFDQATSAPLTVTTASSAAVTTSISLTPTP
ncbi:MAG: carboxypeptidase regulatory-like domain-containing protein [Acidimicrobiales bacterium]